MKSPLQAVVSKRADLLSKAGLPSWLATESCRCCGCRLGHVDILDIGMSCTSANYGDLVVSFMCPKCNALYEYYWPAQLDSPLDMTALLRSAESPGQPFERAALVSSPRRNVLSRLLAEGEM